MTFLKKTFVNLLVVVFICSASFLLIHLIPGDPVDFILKEGANLEERTLLKQQLGLDKPLIHQYKNFMQNLVQLNLGRSLHTGQPVFESLKEHLPFSVRLAFLALFLAFLWGVPLGLMSSLSFLKKYSWGLDLFPLLFFSVPAFVFAPVLIWFFGVKLAWFPVSGAGGFASLFLPALSLALPLGAVLMKVTRVSILEVLPLDFVRTAQAKGLSFFAVHFKHVLRNALVSIVSIMGLQLGALLTGTVIIETIFDRPGLGQLLYQGIVSRDYPLVQASILTVALIYVFVNRLTDWMYTIIHPQMKEAS